MIRTKSAPDTSRALTPKEKREKAALLAKAFPDLMGHTPVKEATKPHREGNKKLLSLRLDTDVIAKFRATGKGWQSRINEALRKSNP